MQGLDINRAVDQISSALRAMDEHAHFSAPELATLTRELLTADLAFMVASGVLLADGTPGESFYDDDDAFEALCDAVIGAREGLDEQAEMRIAHLVDDYMDCAQQYFEASDLLFWE